MFQIIGAMAEFERALIQERVRAGLRNAKAKGKRIGRPRQEVDSSKVLELRAQGLSWRDISRRLKLGVGTVYASIGVRAVSKAAVSARTTESSRRPEDRKAWPAD
jgi:DNA invertase Pin-like site-specific DNA recombinase